MATFYLYGTILTSEAVAANNRGDNIGNTTTLQKVFHQDDLHTSVSAEAIRFSFRYRFQLENPRSVNRSYDGERLNYVDEKRQYWNPNLEDIFIDDDLMGFMDAEAASKETEEEVEVKDELEKTKSRRKEKPKGKMTKRQSPLAIGRAVSLRPYRGELSFNCVSGEKKKGQLSLYSAEMHTTEYQYSFGLNLVDVIKKKHIDSLIDAIIDPPPVAGNHSRFSYDFSPISVVFRVTSAHSSKIQNCFEHNPDTRGYDVRKLINRLQGDEPDIPANEIIIGGDLAQTYEGQQLKELGVTAVFNSVTSAAKEVRKRIAALGDDYQVVAPNLNSESGV